MKATPLDELTAAQIQRLYVDEGWSLSALAYAYSTSTARLKKKIVELGFELREYKPKGKSIG